MIAGIFGTDWIVVPFFGLSIFVTAYFSTDRILDFLYQKSLGNREEIMELMDRMFVETDKEKFTLALIMASFGLGFLFFLVLWPNAIVGLLVGSVITILGWSLPKIVIQSVWEGRCNTVVNQMVDGMTIMANGVKAGLSLTQSMERVVENTGGPLGREFSLVLNKIRLGMSVTEALNEFSERMRRQDVQMFVTAVNILKETGGNLAETFATIVTTIRERQKVEKKIEALTSQGMVQGVIMTAIPFVLMGVFLAIDPNYVMPLFTRPLGWVALALMLILQIIGGIAMKKVVTIKV